VDLFFPTLNVSLNATAGVLLVTGYVLIKRGHERAHKFTMLTCFVVSIAFLSSYLYYHLGEGGFGRKFSREAHDAVRYSYYFILVTHVVLAAIVPLLAIVTIVKGFKDDRESHRRWARWTFPIWLYVSITGVLVYFLLYVFYADV
jgi:uncharacterized membrane protein YozB (DUF420 family)